MEACGVGKNSWSSLAVVSNVQSISHENLAFSTTDYGALSPHSVELGQGRTASPLRPACSACLWQALLLLRAPLR